MKTIFLLALTALAFTSACKKDDTTTPTPAALQLSGTLSGANEKPTTTPSMATGTVTGTYDPTTKLLNYTVTFSGLSSAASAGHLHYGDPKHAGNVALAFASVPQATSGTITGSATLSQMQADSLTMGHIYANIHTANYAGGEVRANVVAK